jgi:hypothetical protein
MTERLAYAQAMIKSMGVKLHGLGNQLSNVRLPTKGPPANAC